MDHYLGLSTVLNIFGLRFTNRMLESVLDSTHVASVDILLDESLALEGRAGYYDHAGALVDMLQSHALHVLSLLAMEPPSSLGPATYATARRRCCGPLGYGATTRSATAGGPATPQEGWVAGRCRRTRTSRASIPPGAPRPSPRWWWR